MKYFYFRHIYTKCEERYYFCKTSVSVCVNDISKTTYEIFVKFLLSVYQGHRMIEFQSGANPKAGLSEINKYICFDWSLIVVIFKKISKIILLFVSKSGWSFRTGLPENSKKKTKFSYIFVDLSQNKFQSHFM